MAGHSVSISRVKARGAKLKILMDSKQALPINVSNSSPSGGNPDQRKVWYADSLYAGAESGTKMQMQMQCDSKKTQQIVCLSRCYFEQRQEVSEIRAFQYSWLGM